MNTFLLALRQLLQRPAQTALNAVIMGLGIAMVSLLLLGQAQFEERMKRDARGIDLVVGAPGSPMQIMLSSVYHVDIPTGNIPLREVRQVIEREPAVERVMPVALGDNYRGFRIVGTEPAYVDHYGGQLARGEMWTESMEAVVGAEAARRSGLQVGDTFSGAHGLGEGGHVHDYIPYAVVGVLDYTGSVLDRLILTSVQSVWDVHANANDHDHNHESDEDHGHGHSDDHEADGGHDGRDHTADDQITALLVSYASPIAASRLPGEINDRTPWQSAQPAFETARLSTMIAPALYGLQVFGALLIAAALLSVFAVLYQNLRDRRYDFAVMRAIGAGPKHVFRITLAEGVLMVALGLLAGLALGHGATSLVGQVTGEGRAIGLTGLAWAPGQTLLVAGVFGTGVLLSLMPAWLAARIEAASTLRRGY